MPRDDSWRPDYDKVKDIMRPYNAQEDDVPQPEGGAPKSTQGARDWQQKLAEEARQQHKTQARSRRRIWPGVFLRHEPAPKQKTGKRSVALARAYRLHVTAQIAPLGQPDGMAWAPANP